MIDKPPYLQRFRDFAAIPQQLEDTAKGITAMVAIFGLIALAALALSVVALERTSRGH